MLQILFDVGHSPPPPPGTYPLTTSTFPPPTQGNCAEFEKTVVSQCDALIEVIKQRKAELLENVAEEKDMKVRTLKEQVSDCTALLQRTTGLLQFCIEVLKESDAPSFLQVSLIYIYKCIYIYIYIYIYILCFCFVEIQCHDALCDRDVAIVFF